MNRNTVLILVSLEAFLGLTLYLYLQKFPIFPEYQSSDFIQYFRIVGSYEVGNYGSLFSNLLYGDVLFYLTGASLLFHGVSRMVVERDAMAALVFVSPLVVYLSVKAMAESESWALVSTAVYTLGGYVWFGMVFNSGLYANFVGVLASLALAGTVVWFTRGEISLKKVGVLTVVLAFALFSHYSTLLVFPAVLAYCAYVALKDEDRREAAAYGFWILAAPLVLGLAFFSGEVSTLLGFLSANVGGVPSTDWFSQGLLAVPVLGYMVAEVTFDLGAVVLLALAIASLSLVLKSKNEALLIPVVWFLTIMVASPTNATAWRFAFVGLVPLTLLACYPVSLLLRQKAERNLLKSRTFFNWNRGIPAVLVICLIVSGGWVTRPTQPFGAIDNGMTDTGQVASSQRQMMTAFAWMKTTVGTCGYYPAVAYVDAHQVEVGYPDPCAFLDLTDWHFVYSPDFGGPQVEYNAVESSSPETASFYALSQHEEYLIVTNVTSFQLQPCQSSSLVTLTVQNFTQDGASLLVHLFSTSPTFSDAALIVDGQQAASSPMANNSAGFRVAFHDPGVYKVQAQVGLVYSNFETFTIGIGPQPSPFSTSPSTDACHPWNWTSAELSGATLAWNSTDIRIWKLTS